MRRPVLPRIAVVLALLASRSAPAVELPFTGTLTLQIEAFQTVLPSLELHGTGVANAIADVNPPFATLQFPATVFAATNQLIPVTDQAVFPIVGLNIDLGNDAGTFAAGANGFGGPMPLRGVAKVCLFGTCSAAVTNLSIPLSVVGHSADAYASGAVNLTISGAPWTTGTVQLAPLSGNPAESIAGSRQSGVLNLVSPIFISTNIAAQSIVNGYVRVLMLFTPFAGNYCDNGFDDDGDGYTDFPSDPGCESATDPSERIASAPCDDGLDNDGDHRVDAFDPGCESPLDGSERSAAIACDDGFDNDGDGVSDFPADPGCASPTDTSERGTIACDDGADTDGDGLADFPVDPGCSGPGDTSERGPGRVCDDGVDDDGDLTADFPGDAGCASIDDPNERSAAFVCDDGLDEDGDGRIDFPSDPGCASAVDSSERGASLPCDDGLDNDFDGTKDYPGDPGCISPSSVSEQSALLPCDNGLDDDGDGLIDSQQDPGCTEPSDPHESLDFTDGVSHQLAGPSLDNSVYLGSGAGGEPTRLWFASGGVIADELRVDANGLLDMTGGSVGGDLVAMDQADVTIRGGTIGGLLVANDTALIEIVGRDFDLPLGDVLAASGTITGFLRDGGAISIPFTRALGATIRLVPEPGASAAALAALSTLLVARARRRSDP